MKFVVFLILFFVTFALAFAWSSGDPQFECEVFEKTTCFLENVETTWKQPDFKPTADRTWDIETVHVKSGKIPLLTSDLCMAFMSATDITLSNLQIEKLDDYISGAFKSCQALLTLDLSHNLLTTVSGADFKGNYYLEKLNLQNNPITEIGESFFGTITTLKEINLASTQIPYLPLDDSMRKIKNLHTIDLSHTPLLDLEIEKLLFWVPTVKTIHLRDTNILCSRMTEIRNFAGLQGVSLETSTIDGQKRTRDYEVNFSGPFECLSKEQWNVEVMKRQANDLLSDSKFGALLEMIKKTDVKAAAMDQNIKLINENIDHYYIDAAYVSSYISFIGTTLAILLVIVSITSIFMCCKVRRYIEEERYRNYWRQQPYQHSDMVIDSKQTLYI